MSTQGEPERLRDYFSKEGIKIVSDIFFFITMLYWSIGKGQISEAGEDRAGFPCEMLQLYSFVSCLILHAETKTW